jgi:2-dehydro-3-deoxyglucarate aldolase/4-hydroxy-2-oxoheptanedioate aldolase
VRIPAIRHDAISLPLDLGAAGIMAPMVESAEQALQVVAAALYPPRGRRGFGVVHPEDREETVEATLASANEEILVLAQIESAEGVEAVEEIAAVEGVDGLFIGAFDLSIDLGAPAVFDSPELLRAIDAVCAACRKHEKAAGIICSDPSTAKDLIEQGFRCLVYVNDLIAYEHGLRDGVEHIRRAARA